MNANSVETEEVSVVTNLKVGEFIASSSNNSNSSPKFRRRLRQLRLPVLQWLNSKFTAEASPVLIKVSTSLNVAMAMSNSKMMAGAGPFPGLGSMALDAVLDGEVDPTLGFEHRQLPEIKTKRPPGVMTLREWGQLIFPEGKWKKHTFYQTYMEDNAYVKYMKEHKKLVSPWALSFQSYVVAMQKMEEECSESFYREYARQWMKTMNAHEVPPEQKGPEWELLTDASPNHGKSSKANQKRPMESEVSKMSTDVENMDEKLTRMAILQRELDKIKQEMNQG